MHRRTVLAGLATLSAGLAGCGGSASDPGDPGTPQPLDVPAFDFEEGPDGTSVVVLTVANKGDQPRDATMSTIIANAQGERLTAETDVSLQPGDEETYRVEFDVEWAWFDENRNLQGVKFE